MDRRKPDIAALRSGRHGSAGQAYWRGLETPAETEAVQDLPGGAFPDDAAVWQDAVGRRSFLKMMGASLALAGLNGCTTPPVEKIVPYVDPPEEVVPGRPLFFATAFPFGGYAHGVLVESHMGRPTKVEGNPDHPASQGATNVFAQASVLDLYDPDRSTVPLYRGEVSTWEAFVSAMQEARAGLLRNRGAGLRLLTETVTSPTLADQLQTLLEQFPQARWHQYEPLTRDHAREGLRRALGRYVDAVYHFERADIVLALDADFLFALPGSVRYARDFSDRRRIRAGQTEMNRLYVVESTPTISGATADHRLPLPPSRIVQFAYALAAGLGVAAAALPVSDLPSAGWLSALTRDLEAHRGRCLVVAGETLPPAVHALVHAVNEALGNVGQTVTYIGPVEAHPTDHHASLRALARDMRAGRVETLLMLGGNPAYAAPVDLAFAEALAAVPATVHLSLYVDETSSRSVWHLPRTHYLETWSDARAYDGTASVVQPLIAPLYEPCRSEHEVLALLMGQPGQTSFDAVQAYWRGQRRGPSDFDAFWHQALYSGVVRVEDSGLKIEDRSAGRETGRSAPPDTLSFLRPPLSSDATAVAPDTPSGVRPPAPQGEGLEIVFRPDPASWDGRFANSGWLQELPKPVTKLVWGNAALAGPALAHRLGLENEDVVELHYRGHTVNAPIWIVPGHADGAVTVYLGHGRTHAGRVGDGVGFNAYRLRTSDAPWTGTGLSLRRTDATYRLVSTQHHHSMEGRTLVKEADIERFRQNPDLVQEGRPIELPSLYPAYAYDGYKWGMVIDTNACIGCNACIVACQAENNIPVVGKEQAGRQREMHWLRVDRYYKGHPDNPATLFQPVPCMHCEDAPCELVCPVAATVHDAEGLNVMVYNRCIGTRYCSNNCPYKVRRFNFLQFADWTTESLKLGRNPDVTVRSRGVMEKCTYCIQRISAARITAKKEDRTIRDGEVRTACQMACPTQAIVFGDLNDRSSHVARLHEQPHNYSLLHELGTRPRTTYLAHFRNPNPEV